MKFLHLIISCSSITSSLSFTFPSGLGALNKRESATEAPSSFTYKSGQYKTRIYSSSSDSANNQSAVLNGESAFDTKSLDFTMGYMNKHHRKELTNFAIAFTPLGIEQMKKNAFSGGSYKITDAKLVDIVHPFENSNELSLSSSDNPSSYLELEVTIEIRGQKEPSIEKQIVPLDAMPNEELRKFQSQPLIPRPSSYESEPTKSYNAIDDFIRRLNRLCLIVNAPSATGKLTQLSFQINGSRNALLREDLYLNQVPHNRYVREYFYNLASDSVLNAVVACSKGQISNRMKIISMFPEMNPQMDSYRIGTLLELARSIAITLAEQNIRVRVCVQGSMGVGIFTGTPKQLSGAATLLQRMDWQSRPGEENEGMVGNFVNFGAVGKEHVVNKGIMLVKDEETGETKEITQEQDDVFLLLCPQSMVGVESSIIQALQEMVDAAGDRPVILLNPDLSDKVSSQGQQNIRGRKDRLEFADSFKTIHQFQNIYVSGTSYFPILGTIYKHGYDDPYVSYQRRDKVGGGEIYVPVLSTEEIPEGDLILNTFD